MTITIGNLASVVYFDKVLPDYVPILSVISLKQAIIIVLTLTHNGLTSNVRERLKISSRQLSN